MRDVLDDVATIGPFFAAEGHLAKNGPRAPWRRMAELVEDADCLTARIHGVREALAESVGRSPDTVELRVAASVAQLGLVARLLSPVLGAALTARVVPDVTLDAVWWQPVLGRPFPLSLPLPGTGEERATRAVVDGPVSELTEAVAATVSVSRRVLWGNVASAINSAVTLVTAARAELSYRAETLAATLLEEPPLRGTASVGVTPGSRFRRHSCCLIYRVAPDAAGAVCGDCVLRR